MQLLVATRNKDKLKELAAMLHDLQIDVISVSDMPRLPEVVEDGATIRDNAIKKAVETARVAKKLTLADDTGLEVDALKGEPGVRSARFAGEDATYHENNKKLLQRLEGVAYDKRTARFRCVVAIADGQTKTFAELSPEVKNRISHRAKAMQKAWAVLSRYLREHSAGNDDATP